MDEIDDEPLNLPLLEADEEDTYFLLLPGLDRYKMKRWDWHKEDGVLVVEVYYGGFDDEGNLRASRYPVSLTEEKEVLLETSKRLIPINPLNVEFERWFDEVEAEEYRQLFEKLDPAYRI